jgi:hypothetical protein
MPAREVLLLGAGTGLFSAPASWIVYGLICAMIAGGVIVRTVANAKHAEMAIGGWSFGGAMAILAVVSLVMAHRKFRRLQARILAEIERSLMHVEAPDDYIWYVPSDHARDLVRTIAERHRAGRILRQLDNPPEEKIANAVDCFAYTIDVEEIPLALIDTSFFQDGSAGFLLTNARFYSSRLSRPLGLEEIDKVVVRRPDLVDYGIFLFTWLILGPLSIPVLYKARGQWWSHRLIVNGEVVYVGSGCSTGFWPEALMALGAAARQAEDPRAEQSDEPDATQTDITSKPPTP